MPQRGPLDVPSIQGATVDHLDVFLYGIDLIFYKTSTTQTFQIRLLSILVMPVSWVVMAVLVVRAIQSVLSACAFQQCRHTCLLDKISIVMFLSTAIEYRCLRIYLEQLAE